MAGRRDRLRLERAARSCTARRSRSTRPSRRSPAEPWPACSTRFPGCRTVKVKVAERGQSLAEDEAGCRGARRARPGGAHPHRRQRRAGTSSRPTGDPRPGRVSTSSTSSSPARAWTNWPRSAASVPGRADRRRRERAQGRRPARRGAGAGAADILVIKAQPLGGIAAALGIAAQAGLPVVVSSALDTSVGHRDGRAPGRGHRRPATMTAVSAPPRCSRPTSPTHRSCRSTARSRCGGSRPARAARRARRHRGPHGVVAGPASRAVTAASVDGEPIPTVRSRRAGP